MISDAVKPKRKARGKFHHGDLREQLVLAATELLEKKGHHAFSMKELAARLGVTEPAIYRHFEGREALFAEVALRGYLTFIEAISAEVAHAVDPFDSIRRYSRCYVRYCVAHPGWFRVQFTRAATENLYKFSESITERLLIANQSRLQLLEQWKHALPPGDDAERVADLYRAVWSHAHGIATFIIERVWQLVQTDEERIAAGDEAIELLVQSIEARARSR